MKKILLIVFLINNSLFAQINPIIDGDTMLCPFATGILTCQGTFEYYQWYKKPLDIPTLPTPNYSPIIGQNNDTLHIDQFNFSGYYIKLKVVNSVGDTLESNEKFIDGYAFQAPYTMTFYNDWRFSDVETGTVFICEGDTIGLLFGDDVIANNVKWYKDGVLLQENLDTLFLTEAGYYEVGGKALQCPNYFWTNLNVQINNEYCNLGLDEKEFGVLKYNPIINDEIEFTNKDFNADFELFNNYGILISKGLLKEGVIKLNEIPNGIYFLIIDNKTRIKIVK